MNTNNNKLFELLRQKRNDIANETGVKPRRLDKTLVPLFSYFYLLLASVGPWKTFVKKISFIIGKGALEKNKTER